MTTDAADPLDYLFDAECVVYVVNSKQIVISYLYTSIITTAAVDYQMEVRLQALRSRKIGSLRIIKARLLENRLLKEILVDQEQRWLRRPRDSEAALEAHRADRSPSA